MALTVLQKLHRIEKERTIYDIHYCNAGVGFVIYYPEKDPHRMEPQYIAGKFIGDQNVSWREGLSVEKYYRTFEQAVNAEFKRLKKQSKGGGKSG